MNSLLYPILIPIVAGIAVLFIPSQPSLLRTFASLSTPFGRALRSLAMTVSLLVTTLVLFLCIKLFIAKPLSMTIGRTLLLRMDNLSGFVTLFIGLFAFLIAIYSIGFMSGKDRLNQYYAYLLMTLGGSIGAALANDLVLFIAFWGFLGLTLYLLINLGGHGAAYAAKKTLIIVGGADALMVLGLSLVWMLSRTFSMRDISLHLNSFLAVSAFSSLACGAFAKAGAMPLHTWIPASSEAAPLPVMAFLPASLDKLLGIYLLARLSLDMFIVRANSAVSIILLALGAVTVLAAVMMALIQHNLKRLLAYHAVSQVGYMVLGIGTGNPVGIAGGLFHMLNNAIYKYGLFLCGGAVEKKRNTTDLDKLGGLSKVMPITYISCLIAALAISGVPPMNGFVSKWMVYQGIIELGKSGGRLWVIWLAAAIFGSALTLASFMKLIHATFLGQPSERHTVNRRDEVGPSMWIPMVVLAALCVLFGVFAYQIPIRLFIQPSLSGRIVYPGVWDAGLSTGLILVGIVIGVIIYLMGNIKNLRVDEPFIGGEPITEDMRVSGVGFYKTVEDMPFLSNMYAWAKKGYFDIYNQSANAVFFFTRILRRLHNGVLPTYLAWCLIGALVLFFVLR